MARLYPRQNRGLFLDLIGWSEGTSTSAYTQDDGYDVIVLGVDGSAKTFANYARHPGISVLVNRKTGLRSTAAGRYQILKTYAQSYIKSLALPDFGPESQDWIALQLIRECGALDEIDRGEIAKAIALCSSRWASFPGNKYGQPSHTVEALVAKFDELTVARVAA